MADPDDRLIDSLYEAAADPERYDALMDAWGTLLEQELAQDDDLPPVLPERLERHFQFAEAIMARMGKDTGAPGDPMEDLERDPGPAMLVSASGILIALNRAARSAFGNLAGQDISHLCMEPRSLGALRQALKMPSPNEPVSRLAGMAWDRDGDRQYLLFYCTLGEGNTSSAAGKLVAAGLNWDESTASQLGALFELTPAEMAIARGWVEGQTLAEMAEEKHRSLQTLRTQAKSLLRKTGQRSQLDLVRLIAGMALATGNRAATERPDHGDDSMLFDLPDGRRMHVAFAGPLTGAPMVLMHGMLSGSELSSAASSALEALNLRLIMPWRPSYAESSPHAGKAAMAPYRHARDVAALLDHLGHDGAIIAGQASGFMYAACFAGLYPHKVRKLFGIASGVPIATKAQIRDMPPRQRFVAYTARHLPKILPVLLKAGIAQIASNGIDSFIDALYPEGTIDGAVSRRADIRDIMRRAYRATTRQGHAGFEIEMWHAVRDWSDLLLGCKVPFTLIHGQRDGVVRIDHVRDLCARTEGANLIEIPANGQLVLHDDPVRVLSLIMADGTEATTMEGPAASQVHTGMQKPVS